MNTIPAIVIPTGRGGCCVVLPCGCSLSLFALAGTGVTFALLRRAAARRAPPTADA